VFNREGLAQACLHDNAAGPSNSPAAVGRVTIGLGLRGGLEVSPEVNAGPLVPSPSPTPRHARDPKRASASVERRARRTASSSRPIERRARRVRSPPHARDSRVPVRAWHAGALRRRRRAFEPLAPVRGPRGRVTACVGRCIRSRQRDALDSPWRGGIAVDEDGEGCMCVYGQKVRVVCYALGLSCRPLHPV
jgi:hypothetical protein